MDMESRRSLISNTQVFIHTQSYLMGWNHHWRYFRMSQDMAHCLINQHDALITTCATENVQFWEVFRLWQKNNVKSKRRIMQKVIMYSGRTVDANGLQPCKIKTLAVIVKAKKCECTVGNLSLSTVTILDVTTVLTYMVYMQKPLENLRRSGSIWKK